MKKLSILFAALATMMGFTACDADDDPVWQVPTPGSFVLNTPPMADETFVFTEGDNRAIEFTVSQPDYGFIASVTYGIQIDIDDQYKGKAEDGSVAHPTPVNVTPEQPTQAKIVVTSQQISEALCELRGIDSKDNWEQIDPIPVKVRATAIIGDIESTFVESNWITLKAVQGYDAIKEPGYIYLVGAPEGWKGPDNLNAAHYSDWRLFEKRDEIGSKVYWGVFDIAAGNAMFRFYTALTGWDTDSYGSQSDDNPLDYEFNADGIMQTELVKGKGSFNFPNWEGGEMTICVDMSRIPMEVTMYKGNQM
ncbi:MAG: SusE domain-containing protein [Muribaculaceae bacterium]|nr:SusE domain-containing protein [Muribaculaceae bacterium]